MASTERGRLAAPAVPAAAEMLRCAPQPAVQLMVTRGPRVLPASRISICAPGQGRWAVWCTNES